MSDIKALNLHLVFIKDELEEELEEKQALLNALEAELAQQELALITLRTHLKAFERHYMQSIGILQAQLDELEVRYAELLAQAQQAGVEVICYCFQLSPDGIALDVRLPLLLDETLSPKALNKKAIMGSSDSLDTPSFTSLSSRRQE